MPPTIMINPTELPIKQLNGKVEKFFIAHANELLQDLERPLPAGFHEYRVYNSTPMNAFSIKLEEKADGLYMKNIDHNSPDYKKKNIVFEVLRFITDQHKSPVFSSLKEGFYTDDESDRLMPDTMGERWAKMRVRCPDRVKFLYDTGRYVFLPNLR